MMRTIELYMADSELTSTEVGLNATNALVNEDSTPIGWADFGNPSKIFFISSSTWDSSLMSWWNFANSSSFGNSPKINR